MRNLSIKKGEGPVAAVGKCSSKQLFLKLSQYSQENTCIGISLLKRECNTGVSCEYFEIFKNSFF